MSAYLSNTLTNLCITLYCILLDCVVLNCIVLLIYCYVDIIQYNAMHKFVRVLDNLPCLAKEKIHYSGLLGQSNCKIYTLYVHVPSRLRIIVFMPKCRNSGNSFFSLQ